MIQCAPPFINLVSSRPFLFLVTFFSQSSVVIDIPSGALTKLQYSAVPLGIPLPSPLKTHGEGEFQRRLPIGLPRSSSSPYTISSGFLSMFGSPIPAPLLDVPSAMKPFILPGLINPARLTTTVAPFEIP